MRSILLIFLLASAFHGRQVPATPEFQYYNYTPGAGWTLEVSCYRDSLTLIKRRGPDTKDRETYSIQKREKRGDYLLIYVKKEFPATPSPKTYSLFVFSFPANRTQVSLLHEYGNWYNSEQENETAFKNESFTGKYFLHGYSKSLVASFSGYKKITAADTVTLRKIRDDFADEINGQKEKISNTNLGDVYGAATIRDLISTVLIRNGFDPSTDPNTVMTAFQQAHLPLPRITPIHRTHT